MMSPLRSARLIACLTTEELGERIGVTADTIRRWERGDQVPTLHNVVALSRELDQPASKLFPDLFDSVDE